MIETPADYRSFIFYILFAIINPKKLIFCELCEKLCAFAVKKTNFAKNYKLVKMHCNASQRKN